MTTVKTYNHDLWDHGITQGYSVNGTIYISGQFSHDTEGAFVGEGDIEAQTRQTLENLDRVLAGFGVTKSNLAYVEIYLTNAQEHFRALHSAVQGIHRTTQAGRQLHRRNIPGVSRAADRNQSRRTHVTRLTWLA
ncbi:RidA family protein [Paenibacillus sp. S28]|nr:RidA family protein [Paenibacillus sp. S28]